MNKKFILNLRKDKMLKSFILPVFFFLLVLTSLSFVSASFGINNPNLPSITRPISTGSGDTNYYNNSYSNITIINGSSYNSSYVPYTGATTDVDLGTYDITADRVASSDGSGNYFDLFIDSTKPTINFYRGNDIKSYLALDSNNNLIIENKVYKDIIFKVYEDEDMGFGKYKLSTLT